MPFGSIRLNNKEVVYGRFIKQIPEFKKKTGVDEIRFTGGPGFDEERSWMSQFTRRYI